MPYTRQNDNDARARSLRKFQTKGASKNAPKGASKNAPKGMSLPEMLARSPALAIASTVLDNLSKAAREKEASLADRFISSTHDWCKAFNYNAKEEKAVASILLAYRKAMRHANRFVLDNEFTRYAVEISSRVTPEKLLYRLQLATLPYETTWIEFDLKTKVRTARAIFGESNDDTSQVAQRCGFLIERIDGTSATVTIVTDGWAPHGVICPNFSGYVFSVNDRLMKYTHIVNGCTPFDAAYRLDKLREMPEFADVNTTHGEGVMDRAVHGAMWGFSSRGHASGTIKDRHDLADSIMVPDLLRHHGQLTFSRFYDFFEFAHKDSAIHTSELVSYEVAEFAGMMRFLACVLAMLNEVPTTMSWTKPAHSMRAGLTRRVDAFDYHTVTLKLPKTKPVPFIERKLSNVDRHNRAHEVRQHWRTYLQEVRCKIDEHAWEYDYNEGYRLCGKCMSFSRMISNHVRGDASLGWTHKSYVIKTNKQE